MAYHGKPYRAGSAENAIPETTIIIKLSDIFHVTTDYLLKNEEYTESTRYKSMDSAGDNTNKKRNKNILIGVAGIVLSFIIILVVLFIALANPNLRTGTSGQNVNIWNFDFWVSNELIPILAFVLIVFIVGVYHLGKYYFCDYQPKE